MATIFLQEEQPERIVARYLRERMTSAEANKLAEEITKSLVFSTPASNRASIMSRHDYRGMPQRVDREDMEEMVTEARRWCPTLDTEGMDRFWRMIWNRSIDISLID